MVACFPPPNGKSGNASERMKADPGYRQQPRSPPPFASRGRTAREPEPANAAMPAEEPPAFLTDTLYARATAQEVAALRRSLRLLPIRNGFRLHATQRGAAVSVLAAQSAA